MGAAEGGKDLFRRVEAPHAKGGKTVLGSKRGVSGEKRVRKEKRIPRRLALRKAASDAEKPRCIALARSGQRCQSAPLQGKTRCLFHSGNFARELGAKGGRRRAVFNPANLEPMTAPRSAADLLLLLSQTILEVRAAKIDTRAANSIAYLGASLLRAIEISDLTARLKRLEDRQREQEHRK